MESLPFEEAITYLKSKVDIPTKNWTDIQSDAHDVAFVIAGLNRVDLLAELHQEIDNAIKNGTTLADFRKSFDEIVQRHGWTYKGQRGWRTSVIFDTNMHAARAAGRWQQFERLRDNMDTEPNLRYTSILGRNTRLAHRHLHGTIRPMNDGFWRFYYPPNGYRCQCMAITVSESQMQRRKWNVSEEPKLGTYNWKNPKTGKVESIPEGIDPGFNYPPGAGQYMKAVQETALAKKLYPKAIEKALRDFFK